MLAVALVGALAWWSEIRASDVVAACKRLSPTTFALAFAVHVAIHAVRAQRFRTLIPPPERPGYLGTFAAASAHNLAAYVLPAKTGEVALVVYLKGHCGVSAKAGLAALLVSRVLDLSTLAFALALAAIHLRVTLGDQAPPGMATAAALGLAVAAALTVLAARSDWLVTIAQRIARIGRLDRTALGAKLAERSGELATALRAAATGKLATASLQSLAMWLGIFLFYGILARGFGLPERIGLPQAALGSGLAVLSNLLPINSFAGFGTQEAGWVVGFGLLGIDRELAFSTGVSSHLVQLLNTIVLGLAGHAAMGLMPRQGGRSAPGSSNAG